MVYGKILYCMMHGHDWAYTGETFQDGWEVQQCKICGATRTTLRFKP